MAHWQRLTITGLLLSLLALPVTIRGQVLEDIVIYDQAGAEVMFGHDGWLYKAEITQGDVQPFAAMPADTLFAPNTYPQYNSAVLTATHFWIWDSSVGTVVRYDRESRSTVFSKRPSLTRFSHNAVAHPTLGHPLVFGGYGYYRAKDFFLQFVPSLGEWRELPASRRVTDPPPLVQSTLLDYEDGKTVLLVEGHTSDNELMPLYNRRLVGKAWSFDVEAGAWSPIPFDPILGCLMRPATTAIDQDFRGEGRVLIGVLSLTSTGRCNQDLDPPLESGRVFIWQPERRRYAILETRVTFNGNTLPAGLLVTDDSLAIAQVGFSGDAEVPIRLVNQTIPLPETIVWRPLRLKQDRFWFWAIGIPLVLVLAVLTLLVWRVRRHKLIRYRKGAGEIRLQAGFSESVEGLPPNALAVLVFMASAPRGTHFGREDLESAFEDRAYAPDTLRTITNRALATINEIGNRRFDCDIIERRQGLDDKRRQLYFLTVRVKLEK